MIESKDKTSHLTQHEVNENTWNYFLSEKKYEVRSKYRMKNPTAEKCRDASKTNSILH